MWIRRTCYEVTRLAPSSPLAQEGDSIFFPSLAKEGKAVYLAGVLPGCKLPVDQIPEGLHVLGAEVAVVDVIRMLPDVAGEQRSFALSYRGTGIAGAHDFQRTIGIFHQPGPARPEGGNGALGEFFLEVGKGAELLVDGFGQCAAGLTAAVGTQAIPVEGMVPYLGGIVENATGGLLDDVLQGQRLECRTLDQVVQVGDVSLMVLAVMVFDGFFGDIRYQSVFGVRQGR